MALASLKQLVADKVRSLSLGKDLASPLVLERAIDQAVLAYGLDVPLETWDDLVGVTGGQFDVPPGWVEGRSQLVAVEYPIGVAPMATLEAAIARSEGGVWQVMLAADTLADATVRVHFTAPHTVTADASTVPAEHENAVACWAAAEVCRQVATQKAGDRDATIGAAAVQGGSQSGELARRAREWMVQYRTALGLPDPEALAGGQAAGTVVQFERRSRWRFHSWGV